MRRLNEFLDGLLPLLDGDEAKATGEITTTRLAVNIPGAPPPPVYMAALGPQMLKVTGRRTAGTMTWMTGPRTLADHIIPTLDGVTPPGGRRAEVVAGFPVCVTDAPDQARAHAAEIFEIYGLQPSYRAMLDREGYGGPADVAIIGNEAEVSRQIDAIAALGVEELSGYVFARTAEDDERTRNLLASRARLR